MMASTYGWSHREILSLTARQFIIYLREIDTVEARKFFLAVDATSYPHLKDFDRAALTRRYNAILNPPTFVSDPKRVEDAWRVLREAKKDARKLITT